jgi:hypothetical protein
MPPHGSFPARAGASALAASALLFAIFPAVRPFFRLEVFSPTLAAVASAPVASPAWVVAHLLLTAAFALLPIGLLTLAATLGAAGPCAARSSPSRASASSPPPSASRRSRCR